MRKEKRSEGILVFFKKLSEGGRKIVKMGRISTIIVEKEDRDCKNS